VTRVVNAPYGPISPIRPKMGVVELHLRQMCMEISRECAWNARAQRWL
jgi:hypothetical protein